MVGLWRLGKIEINSVDRKNRMLDKSEPPGFPMGVWGQVGIEGQGGDRMGQVSRSGGISERGARATE